MAYVLVLELASGITDSSGLAARVWCICKVWRRTMVVRKAATLKNVHLSLSF